MADWEGSPITSILYPNTYDVNTDEGFLNGVIKTNENFNNIYNYTHADYVPITLVENPRISEFTRPNKLHLIRYSNDCDLMMDYYTVKDDNDGWEINAEFYILNAEGEEINRIVYIPEGETEPRTVYSGRVSQTLYIDNYLIHQGQLANLNDISIRYYPSYTDYSDNGGTKPLTDGSTSPTSIHVLGEFVSTKGVTTSIDELDREPINIGAFTPFRFNNVTLTSFQYQEDLDAFNQGIINAGDGSDPFDKNDDDDKPPYENDDSGRGGGKGKYEHSDEKIGKGDLPIGSAIGSGMVSVYNPTQSQLVSLSNKLWSDDFFDNIIKLWNDPMQAIISLSLLPCSPSTLSAQNCVIGNYDTEIPMPVVSQQYLSVDCGYISVNEYWGNALDYSPYTKAELFLPFVGMIPVNIDDFMDRNVHIFYNVDILSGSAVCFVLADGSTVYEFSCNVASQIPISSSNYSQLVSGIINTVGGVLVGGVTGGAVGSVVGGALTSASNVVTSKHNNISHGSTLSSNNGILGHFNPYLIVHRPVQSLATNYRSFNGFPSNITRQLGTLSGYTEVESIHLDGINATEQEKDELMKILQEGFIL